MSLSMQRFWRCSYPSPYVTTVTLGSAVPVKSWSGSLMNSYISRSSSAKTWAIRLDKSCINLSFDHLLQRLNQTQIVLLLFLAIIVSALINIYIQRHVDIYSTTTVPLGTSTQRSI